ncbi:MAG: ABC transporter ATP-binding protein [Pseudomonadota bacterium]
MLELRKVNAAYGRAQVLFDLDLELRAGEALVLLGRNGAGKSTALKAAMGLIPVSSGEVIFQSKPITKLEPFRIARLGLGYVPEDRRIFGDLTVAENLEAGRQPPRDGAPRWSAERVFELFPSLGRMPARRASDMSGGEQQMLAIGRTLMGNPGAMLLDEPFEGLAPLVAEAIVRTIAELKREGLALLLSDQHPRRLRRFADRACIIEKGRLRYSGTMTALDADPGLRERFLSV